MNFKHCKFLTFKKFSIIFLVFLIFFFQAGLLFAQEDDLTITAFSGVLVDGETGRILWEKNSNTKRPMASTTKMMTAVLAIENVSLNDVVTTSTLAADAGEAEMYLSPGEKITVERILYGVLLKSGNDAAVALAEHVGGSVEGFMKMMNEKAEILGAKRTHFLNPTGLEQEGHYSTAGDLALIARYCLQNEKFAEIVATKEHTVPWPNNPYPRTFINHNKLLLKYDYVDGVKTGYTKKAGYCLVASVTKGKKRLISVVLNAPTSKNCYEDSKKILDFGLKEFERKKIVRKGDSFRLMPLPTWKDELNLVAEEDLLLLTGKEPDGLKKIILVKYPDLPVFKGQKIGEIKVVSDQVELGKVNLVADKNIFASGFTEKIYEYISSFLKILSKK